MSIATFYDYYLGRSGGLDELDYWQKQLDSGAKSMDQIRRDLVGSSEYQNKAATSTSPFIYGNSANPNQTAPVLTSNPNSAFGFNFYTSPEGNNGGYVTPTGTGESFDPFKVSSTGSTQYMDKKIGDQYKSVADSVEGFDQDFISGWTGFDGSFDDYMKSYSGDKYGLVPKTGATNTTGGAGVNGVGGAANQNDPLFNAINDQQTKSATVKNVSF
jgi:hypothetical protein